MKNIHVFCAALLATVVVASAAWTYVDNDGSGTYSGTVKNYSSNDKPYHGYITDGNVSIWVYKHDVNANEWTLGAGGFGVDGGSGGSVRAGMSGGAVKGDSSTLYEGDIDLSDANAAIQAATGDSSAAFTVIGKRCFRGYNKAINILGFPATVATMETLAFKSATGLRKADFSMTQLSSLPVEAFESANSNNDEQEFWFPETLVELDKRCLAWGANKRTIHFLGDVPEFTEAAAADGLTIYAGSASKQWAYCVNALKYPRWTSQKSGEFDTGHQSWIPKAVRYKNASDEYAVDETTGAVTWPKPFGVTKFGTTANETYLIQEGFPGESAVPVVGLSSSSIAATTASFEATLITIPEGAESVDLLLQVASDDQFETIVDTQSETLTATGTAAFTVSGLDSGTSYFARLIGTDDTGAEGEVAVIAFKTLLGRDGGYWVSDAPSADVGEVAANTRYNLYSTDGAFTFPIRVSGGVWQIGAGYNENQTTVNNSISGHLDLSTVEADTGIVLMQTADAVFYGRGVQDVVFPDSLQTLGEQMFALCGSLTNAVFPGSLTAVRNRAFRDTGLVNADFSAATNVAEIQYEAFLRCRSLPSVDLRSTAVTNIAYSAFQTTSNLSEIWLSDQLQSIGNQAFYEGPQKRFIHFRTAPPTLTGNNPGQTFYPGNANARWVYFVDDLAFPEWKELVDPETPYDAETMASALPDGFRGRVIGTTTYGTTGANAILVYEKVKEMQSVVIIR